MRCFSFRLPTFLPENRKQESHARASTPRCRPQDLRTKGMMERSSHCEVCKACMYACRRKCLSWDTSARVAVWKDGAAKKSERRMTFLFATLFLEYQIYSFSKSLSCATFIFIGTKSCSNMSHAEKSDDLGWSSSRERSVILSPINPFSNTNITFTGWPRSANGSLHRAFWGLSHKLPMNRCCTIKDLWSLSNRLFHFIACIIRRF